MAGKKPAKVESEKLAGAATRLKLLIISAVFPLERDFSAIPAARISDGKLSPPALRAVTWKL